MRTQIVFACLSQSTACASGVIWGEVLLSPGRPVGRSIGCHVGSPDVPHCHPDRQCSPQHPDPPFSVSSTRLNTAYVLAMGPASLIATITTQSRL